MVMKGGVVRMSFVSVIATEKFITVMSDGLVYNMITDEEIEQRYQKFRKISENQFIAFGGDRGLAEKVVEDIGYQNEERELLPIAASIRETLIKEVSPQVASCQVILGGIEKNEIVFYSFNNDEKQELLMKKPKGIDGEYSFLGSRENGLDLDKEMGKIYSKYGFKTPTKALKVQKELNDVVSKVDPSVNRITFNLTIRN